MPQTLTNVKRKMPLIRAVFVGDSKSGKSIAATTFPKPMYIFDLDGRIRSIANFYHKNPTALEGIEYDSYDSFTKFGEFFDRLETRCDYKTIIIDSLTTLCNLILRHGLKGRGVPLLSSLGDEKNEKGRVIAGVQIPAWDEWNLEATVLREILYMCSKKFKCNVILTAHLYHTEERDPEKKDEMITKYRIITGGKKAAASIPAEFDEIYHFAAKTNSRKVYTQPTDAVPFAGTTLKLPRMFNIEMNPDEKISRYNGSLYHKIVHECETNGVVAE